MAEPLAAGHKLAAVEPTGSIGALFGHGSQYQVQEKPERGWIFMYLMHLIIVILVEQLAGDVILIATAEFRAWVVLAIGILAFAVITSERTGMGDMTLVSHKNR